MMTYRLDTETALVLASAVEYMQDIEGVQNKRFAVTVEYMQKISKDEKNALTLSMNLEWKSVLTKMADLESSPERVSSRAEEYWSAERTPKVRRIQSEPQSPGPANNKR